MTMRWEAGPAAHRGHPFPQDLDQSMPDSRFGYSDFTS